MAALLKVRPSKASGLALNDSTHEHISDHVTGPSDLSHISV